MFLFRSLFFIPQVVTEYGCHPNLEYGQHTPWVFWDVLGIIYPKSVDQIPKPKDHVSRTLAIAYAILIDDT